MRITIGPLLVWCVMGALSWLAVIFAAKGAISLMGML